MVAGGPGLNASVGRMALQNRAISSTILAAWGECCATWVDFTIDFQHLWNMGRVFLPFFI